jgi:XTP/dITP diphosphohydrolase
VRELVDLLGDLPLDVQALAAVVPGARLPEETGSTYRENALLKARVAACLTGELALGDDSGLEVDALGGRPGVHSARFGGPGLDDAGRWRLLLEALAAIPPPQRTARFRCVIAIAGPEGAEEVVEGVVEGTILASPRGTGGFGYDPVFLVPALGRTLAELTPAEKSRVSHRGRAAAEARRRLLARIAAPPAPGGPGRDAPASGGSG